MEPNHSASRLLINQIEEKPESAKPLRAAKNYALLIGSSYHDLKGTAHDVDTMADILKVYGFNIKTEVTKLCGDDATRDKILSKWEDFTLPSIQNGDVVIIYYSGHGGLAERPRDISSKDPEQIGEGQPDRVQFLVPSDFDSTLGEWRGILDTEISLLLRKVTGRTSNVTYILDCCHSARLGKGPGQEPPPVAKFLPFDYWPIVEHMKRLREQKKLFEDQDWTNPDVVRIAAAGDRESAWQYCNSIGQHVGVMTDKLKAVMTDPRTQLS